MPRDLGGQLLVEHLVRRWDYARVHQTGSYIVLRIETLTGQTLVIPAHKPLKLRTLGAILRSVSAHKLVSREILLKDLL